MAWTGQPIRELCETVEGHSLCESCCDWIGFTKREGHIEKKARKCDKCGQLGEDNLLILHKAGVECWEGDPLEVIPGEYVPLVPIEVIRWRSKKTVTEVYEFLGWELPAGNLIPESLIIETPSGFMVARPGDFILRDARGK